MDIFWRLIMLIMQKWDFSGTWGLLQMLLPILYLHDMDIGPIQWLKLEKSGFNVEKSRFWTYQAAHWAFSKKYGKYGTFQSKNMGKIWDFEWNFKKNMGHLWDIFEIKVTSDRYFIFVSQPILTEQSTKYLYTKISNIKLLTN